MLSDSTPPAGGPKTEDIGESTSVNADADTAPLVALVAATAPPVPEISSSELPSPEAQANLSPKTLEADDNSQPIPDISSPELPSAEAQASLSSKTLEGDHNSQLTADRSLKDDDILAEVKVNPEPLPATELRFPEANSGDEVSDGGAPQRSQLVEDKNTSSKKLAGAGSPGAEATSPIQLLRFPSWPFAVDVKPDYFRDFIVAIPGLVSIVVTVIIAILANQINQQQAASQAAQSRAAQEQSKAAQDEVNVNFIEEFRKHLGDLTLPEGGDNLTKKTLAAITLAQYGERALPALKMSLNVEDKNIREGAAVVIAQMLLDRNLRPTVLSKLEDYFGESDATLRVGVLVSYVTINRKLTDPEFNEISRNISKDVAPTADYTDKLYEKEVLLWAVKFYGNWPRVESKKFLLAVAQNSSSGDDAREGAINYLPRITRCATGQTESEREASAQEVLTALEAILSQVPERLRKNITDGITKLQKPLEMQCS